MAAKCRVTITDTSRVSHSVEVAANSLYEAAGLGIAVLQESKILPVGPAVGSVIVVEVIPPAETHRLELSKLQEWLRCAGTPKEMALKYEINKRLKAAAG